MALMDFMNRRARLKEMAGPNQTPPKQETAKQMYTRQAAEEKPNARGLQQLPDDQKQKLDEVKARLEKATRHQGQSSPVAPSAPEGGATSPQPMQQNMVKQDKAAPALTPTSAQAGNKVPEVPAAPAKAEAPPKAQQTPAPKPPTMARRPPSWER